MRDIVADILSVSSAQMGRMESINDHLNDGIKAEFASGHIGISTAYDASTLSEAKQAEVLYALHAGKPDAVRSAVREARDRKLARPVEHFEAPKPEDLQPVVPEPMPGETMVEPLTSGRSVAPAPVPGAQVVRSPTLGRPVPDDHLNGERAAEAKRLSRQLRKIAGGIPYDAVCDDGGDEINIRATCLNAARLLETYADP
jgi:hypothetical protein